jgi:hypothetical protein
MPAATVLFVSRSMRMNAPIARLSPYVSNTSGFEVVMRQWPISFMASEFASCGSSVFTSMRESTSVTTAGDRLVVCFKK